MDRPIVRLALAGLVLSSLPLLPARAQEDPGKAPAGAPPAQVLDNGIPVVPAADLRIVHFRPRYTRAKDLARTVSDLMGRRFVIPEHGSTSLVNSLSVLGDEVLVHEEASYADRLLDLLRELDVAPEGAQELRTVEYRPRYASLGAVLDSLGSFRHPVVVSGPDGLESRIDNIQTVRDRNLLVLRDGDAQLKEMLALLARIDVPAEQVLFTAWVAGGAKGDQSDAALPEELVANMRALLPGFAFRWKGFALVRSSVLAGGRVDLTIEGTDGRYSVELRPAAFDPESGSLSLEQCELSFTPRPAPAAASGEDSAQPRSARIFRTSAVVHAGDYTVIGASGSEPTFLVLRFQRLEGGAAASGR